MSITSALNAALTGLNATSRRAEVVSSNVANASTPGYARREVQLVSGLAGGNLPGVQVAGVSRREDLVLVGQRREAEANLAEAEVSANFFSDLEAAIGLPGDAGSLQDKLSNFEAALIDASSRPDSEARLLSVMTTAKTVADDLNDLSDFIQDARLVADQEIAASVDFLSSALQNVVDLNAKIVQFGATTRDASALVDQRAQVIDSIAEFLPIKQVARENGTVALYTAGGAILVDSKAADLSFTGVPALTVHMTQAGGGLSGLEINGQPISTDSATGPISGGKLAGLFDLRDSLGPQVQTELDALARNLIERFEDSTVDPTLTAGDPGLFTDDGAALDVTEELGLAGRISVNALADPDQSGDLWRLRNGLGAVAIGDPGDSSILNAMSDALADPRVPATGSFTSARSATGLAGDVLSMVSTTAYQAEANVSFNRAAADALITAELQDGVDTDQEMQELLLIEQAYAANARVILTVDELIQQLLRI